MSRSKQRNACFTIYPILLDPHSDDADGAIGDPHGYLEPNWDPNTMSYLVYQLEQCPDTGMVHFQGYVEFKQPMTLGRIQQAVYWGEQFHIERRFGTAKQASDYCKKDESYLGLGRMEFGHLSAQGARGDLLKLRDEIKEGKQVEEILMDDPMIYHQYGRTLEKMEDIRLRKMKRNWQTKGIWYYGETGSGKSHKAFTEHGDNYYVKTWGKDTEWWDGYRGEEVVIFNEFRGQIAYAEILALLDKWPHMVSRRGKEPIPFLAKLVIITCPVLPELIYKRQVDKADGLEQLYRRIEVVYVDKNNREVIELDREQKELEIEEKEFALSAEPDLALLSPHAREELWEQTHENWNLD